MEEDLLEMGEVQGDELGGVYGIRSAVVWTFLAELKYGTGGEEAVYVAGAREIRREVSSRRKGHGQEKRRLFFFKGKKYGEKEKKLLNKNINNYKPVTISSQRTASNDNCGEKWVDNLGTCGRVIFFKNIKQLAGSSHSRTDDASRRTTAGGDSKSKTDRDSEPTTEHGKSTYLDEMHTPMRGTVVVK
jgi:hypothetical protein